MKIIYLNEDGETTGPFSVEEVATGVATGKLKPATMACIEGAKEWQPVSRLLDLLARDARAVPTLEKRPTPREKPAPLFTQRLVLGLLLLTGLCIAFYYGVMFDPTHDGVNNVGLLNDRLVGVVMGSLITLIAALWLVLQRLAEIHQTLKERKEKP